MNSLQWLTEVMAEVNNPHEHPSTCRQCGYTVAKVPARTALLFCPDCAVPAMELVALPKGGTEQPKEEKAQ